MPADDPQPRPDGAAPPTAAPRDGADQRLARPAPAALERTGDRADGTRATAGGHDHIDPTHRCHAGRSRTCPHRRRPSRHSGRSAEAARGRAPRARRRQGADLRRGGARAGRRRFGGAAATGPSRRNLGSTPRTARILGPRRRTRAGPSPSTQRPCTGAATSCRIIADLRALGRRSAAHARRVQRPPDRHRPRAPGSRAHRTGLATPRPDVDAGRHPRSTIDLDRVETDLIDSVAERIDRDAHHDVEPAGERPGVVGCRSDVPRRAIAARREHPNRAPHRGTVAGATREHGVERRGSGECASTRAARDPRRDRRTPDSSRLAGRDRRCQSRGRSPIAPRAPCRRSMCRRAPDPRRPAARRVTSTAVAPAGADRARPSHSWAHDPRSNAWPTRRLPAASCRARRLVLVPATTTTRCPCAGGQSPNAACNEHRRVSPPISGPSSSRCSAHHSPTSRSTATPDTGEAARQLSAKAFTAGGEVFLPDWHGSTTGGEARSDPHPRTDTRRPAAAARLGAPGRGVPGRHRAGIRSAGGRPARPRGAGPARRAERFVELAAAVRRRAAVAPRSCAGGPPRWPDVAVGRGGPGAGRRCRGRHRAITTGRRRPPFPRAFRRT